ncbi:hypothetical protein HYU17_03590 [Candidatus Woesearchaeota archaeon]|nr:hypothetical protein [Candidatus Woesearchaeota archaeon]
MSDLVKIVENASILAGGLAVLSAALFSVQLPYLLSVEQKAFGSLMAEGKPIPVLSRRDYVNLAKEQQQGNSLYTTVLASLAFPWARLCTNSYNRHHSK